MKATYFPFTYISDPVAEMLTDCFGQLIVYRPSMEILSEQLQVWIDRGTVDIRVPILDHEKELNSAIKNYLSWADLHRDRAGEKAAIIAADANPLPLFNEISARKIVDDIKGSAAGNSNTEAPDSALIARIFLYFAQEFDRHNQELTDDLNHQQQQEAELIRQLKMENDPAAIEFQNPPVQLPEPFTDYMVSDRLEAWTRIFGRDPEPSGLFVTHSAAVLELLLDRTSTAARVMHLESTSSSKATDGAPESRRPSLALELARLLEQNQTEDLDNSSELLNVSASDNPVTISVYRVPDQSPYEFFAHSAGIDCSSAGSRPYNRRYKDTLIALVRESRSL